MVKLNNLSAISAAVLLSVSIGTRAAPILANSSDVEKIVNAEDVIERIFASGHEAKITGASINVYDDEASTMAVGATNAGIIVIGDENTERVSIKDPLDETAVVSSQGESQISINAANIIVKGNEGSQGVKVETSGGITIGSAMTDSVDISSGASAVYGKSGNVSIFGKQIKLSSSSSDAVSFYTAGAVTIGDKNTESINLKSSADGCAAVFLKRVATDPGDAGLNATITGNNVTIASDAENGVGIWLQNGTEGADRPAVTTSLTVNANNPEINASQGIVAYSNSGLDIEGDVEINSEVAIVARGNSTVNINETCSTCKMVINGDVVFMTTNTPTDSDNSGRIINADVNLNLSGADSQWNGRAYQTYKDESGEMIEVVDIDNGNEYHGNVENFTVGLKSGAKWKVTGDSFINTVSVSDGATIVVSEDAKVLNSDKIDLNGGVLTMEGDATQQVSVNTLSGTGGTINVATKHSEEGGFTTANLKIANVVTAETAPALAVKYTGITSDALTAENTKDLKALDIASGTASVSEYVEEGDINGAWTRQDGEGGGNFQANTKLTDFSSVNAMSLVQWRNEINHLTKRLGDIRASEGTIGAWARVYGGESQWGGANEVEMDHTTIQVGGDYRINNHWIAGAAFSYTDSRADLSNGDADGDSYSLAVYGTYTADGGSFLDVIGRYGYLKNDITAGNMALDTSSNTFSLSAEMGHTFRFIGDAAYVEPQLEFTYGFISGDDATATNNVRIEQDDFQSFVTRVGVRAGYDFPQKKGSVYGMFSYSYDWMGDADGTASKDGLRQALSQDLGGGWVTYGVGAQIMLGDSAYFYGELERTSGGDIDNPYLFSAGVRMTF